MSEHKVFISYSHEDSEWVQKFGRSLSSHGLNVWMDSSQLALGDNWRDKMEEALRGSDLFVALINSQNVKNPNLFFELGAALALHKQIVGVVPEDFDASKLPQFLRSRRYLIKNSPETTAEELVAATA